MRIRLLLILLVPLCTLSSLNLIAQENVSGTVTNVEGEPLIGVNIFPKADQGRGTISDFDGSFTLTVTDLSETIVFSYIGYTSREIQASQQPAWIIVLEDDTETLDEIVVVGYGVQRKSDLTGAIASVEAEELQKIPTSNLEQALQGKIAGVQVTPTTGEPGRGAQIRIRGVGTLNNASPLYVVDGMLLDDISFVNLQDVESVEVLKDASATAIYGSRGANGVIIISTRKGELSQAAQVSFSAYRGWQQIANKIELTNASEYAVLANELAKNEKRDEPFTDPNTLGQGIDWQDEIFEVAPMQNFNLSFRGGTESTRYQVSADFFDQEGIQTGSNYQRFTLRINNDYQIRPNLKLGHNVAVVRQWRESVPDQSSTVYRADPTISPRNEAGDFNDLSTNASTGNPVASLFYSNNKVKGYRLVGNAFAEVKFLQNFTFRTNFGFDIEQTNGKFFTPEFFVSATQRNEENDLRATSDQVQNWLWENTVTYYKEWTDHRLNVLGGITSQVFNAENLSGTARGLIGETDEFLFLNAAQAEEQSVSNGSSEWAMLSYLFRINYTFKDKYLFTGSFRTDGSSRFGADNRYGYFPSIAVGWNLTNEAFMANQTFLSRLKFRSSWGVIGNDKIGAYPGRPVVNSPFFYPFGSPEVLNVGATIEGLPNAGIQWEETAQFNIGVELGFLNNRLTGEVDYYSRTTDKILIDLALPGHFGIRDNFPFVNAAKVRNTGVDLKLDWQDGTEKFSYRAGLVLSTVNNEVLELGENKSELIGGSLFGGQFGTRTVPGLPIGAFYGYEVAGVFQNEAEIANNASAGVEVPGDLRYVDTDGDGSITTADRTFLGSPIPDLLWGASLGFELYGVDFSFDLNGQSGNKIYNSKKAARFGTYNFERIFLDRWSGEGTSNAEPRVTNGGHNYLTSERFLEDGSYWRVRNISIGYTLPTKVLGKLQILSMRIYASATNPFTATDYTGYTTEFSSSNVLSAGIDQGVYPIAKIYNIGINASF